MVTKPADQTLIDAVRWGNRIAALRALREGADVLAKDENGNDVVLIAGGLSHWLIVEDLLLCGADVEAQTAGYGSRLIHLAAEDGDWGAVCRLLHFKASINVVNRFGETPLDLASRNSHHRVVELLLQNGARPESEMLHVKDIAEKVAADYTIQHFGERYACLCGHGLSLHTKQSSFCEGIIRHQNGDEELCTCDAFADVWGRGVPSLQPEYRSLFGDYDLESF